MGYHLAYRQLTGKIRFLQGSDHSAFSPYGAFKTGQGGYILIGVSNDRQFERLASSLSHEEWTRNPRYQSNDTRVKHRGELRNQIEDVLRTKGPKDWEGILSKANVPVVCLQKVYEVLRDPQAKANALFYSVLGSGGRLLVPRIPFSMSTHSLMGAHRASRASVRVLATYCVQLAIARRRSVNLFAAEPLHPQVETTVPASHLSDSAREKTVFICASGPHNFGLNPAVSSHRKNVLVR